MRGGFGTFRFLSHTFCRRIPAAGLGGIVCCCMLPACAKETGFSGPPASAPAVETPESDSLSGSIDTEPPRKYDGLTLDEWKERLKTLGPGVPEAESAIPGLTAIAEDRAVPPEIRNQATMMLGRLGKPGLAALPTLKKLLKEAASEEAIPAVWSAKAIGLLGPEARDATPVLIEVLEAPATPIEAQLACLEALARIGGHHAKAIPAIVRTLNRASNREFDTGERALLMAAVDAFFLLGAGASIAVPELMELLDHPQLLVRLKVVQALGAIGKPSSPAANALAEMLIFDESEAIRRAAAFALAAIGPEGQGLLYRLAQDEEAGVRQNSVEALGTVTPRNEELETILVQALGDDNAEVRLAAAVALKNETSHRPEILQTFARLVTDRDRSIKLSAANHLSSMQPDDAEWEQLSGEVEHRLDRVSQRLWQRIERMREDER